MAENNKSYENLEEYTTRFSNFINTDIRLQEHIQTNPDATYTVGHNEWSDYSKEEIEARLNHDLQYEDQVVDSDYNDWDASAYDSDLMNLYATNLDWCNKGDCNSIRSQGGCSSCWAFSAIAVVEARFAKKHGFKATASEQQCVSCQDKPSCGGGT